jgi:stage IV sporulation protein FB
MRENSHWSLNCGLWGGVRVYLHASLLVVFVAIVYFATQFAHLRAMDDGAMVGLLACAILLVSLALHELGHALAACQVGGSVDLVVIGPLGGMHWPNVPREPQREVLVALAGPAVHFLVLLALGPLLIIFGANLGDILLHPFYPSGMLSHSPGIVAAKIAFWFNWLLLLVNLIPAPSLDSGRALRSILWPVMGYRGAIRTVSRSGMLVAMMMCLLALLLPKPPRNPNIATDNSIMMPSAEHVVPTWLPLILLAMYFYFSSHQELHRADDDDPESDLFGYDFSQGFTSLEQPVAGPRRRNHGPMRRWLQQRQETKERRLREIEAEEERRVDDVLIRLKEVGIDALSPEERSLLHRVSARYRSRLQS